MTPAEHPDGARRRRRAATPGDRRRDVQAATTVADRLDVLAETAELMGDDAGAGRLRVRAADVRLEAMRLLDLSDEQSH